MALLVSGLASSPDLVVVSALWAPRKLLRPLLWKLVSNCIGAWKEGVHDGVTVICRVVVRSPFAHLSKSILQKFCCLLVVVVWLTSYVASQSCIVEVWYDLSLCFVEVLRWTPSLLSLCEILNLGLLSNTGPCSFSPQLIWGTSRRWTLSVRCLLTRGGIPVLRLHILQRHIRCIILLKLMNIDNLLILLTNAWHLLTLSVTHTSHRLSRRIHKAMYLVRRWSRRLCYSLFRVAVNLREIRVELCRWMVGQLTVSLTLSLNGHDSTRTRLLFPIVSHLDLSLIIQGALVFATEFLECCGIRSVVLYSLIKTIHLQLGSQTLSNH